MAIARFLDRMCLALQASELWLRYATLQNLIPSFSWIVPGWRAWGHNQILPSGNDGMLHQHIDTSFLPPSLLHSDHFPSLAPCRSCQWPSNRPFTFRIKATISTTRQDRQIEMRIAKLREWQARFSDIIVWGYQYLMIISQ